MIAIADENRSPVTCGGLQPLGNPSPRTPYYGPLYEKHSNTPVLFSSSKTLLFDDKDQSITSFPSSLNTADDNNVKVLVRVRPAVAKELGKSVCLQYVGPNSLRLQQGAPHDCTRYTFDAVLGPDTSQERLFKVVGKPLVENALQGFNSTVLAYGQTGSGKTYTMVGQIPGDMQQLPAASGLMARTVRHLFERTSELTEVQQQQQQAAGVGLGGSLAFIVRCSYLEIYNEKLTDLLDPGARTLAIREDARSGVYVDGIKEQQVASAEEALALLRKGGAHRTISETMVNQQSSRSHCVFTLRVESHSLEGGVGGGGGGGITRVRSARLNLVDLAGSERARQTGSDRGRQKEAAAINRSLSTLGLVIKKLTDGDASHVPYRDSQLTRLLQDSLGGNAKTVMVANVSPVDRCAQETAGTLDFARRAKQVKNKAVVNQHLEGEALQLQRENQRLRQELHWYRALQESSDREASSLLRSVELLPPSCRATKKGPGGAAHHQQEEEEEGNGSPQGSSNGLTAGRQAAAALGAEKEGEEAGGEGGNSAALAARAGHRARQALGQLLEENRRLQRQLAETQGERDVLRERRDHLESCLEQTHNDLELAVESEVEAQQRLHGAQVQVEQLRCTVEEHMRLVARTRAELESRDAQLEVFRAQLVSSGTHGGGLIGGSGGLIGSSGGLNGSGLISSSGGSDGSRPVSGGGPQWHAGRATPVLAAEDSSPAPRCSPRGGSQGHARQEEQGEGRPEQHHGDSGERGGIDNSAAWNGSIGPDGCLPPVPEQLDAPGAIEGTGSHPTSASQQTTPRQQWQQQRGFGCAADGVSPSATCTPFGHENLPDGSPISSTANGGSGSGGRQTTAPWSGLSFSTRRNGGGGPTGVSSPAARLPPMVACRLKQLRAEVGMLQAERDQLVEQYKEADSSAQEWQSQAMAHREEAAQLQQTELLLSSRVLELQAELDASQQRVTELQLWLAARTGGGSSPCSPRSSGFKGMLGQQLLPPLSPVPRPPAFGSPAAYAIAAPDGASASPPWHEQQAGEEAGVADSAEAHAQEQWRRDWEAYQQQQQEEEEAAGGGWSLAAGDAVVVAALEEARRDASLQRTRAQAARAEAERLRAELESAQEQVDLLADQAAGLELRLLDTSAALDASSQREALLTLALDEAREAAQEAQGRAGLATERLLMEEARVSALECEVADRDAAIVLQQQAAVAEAANQAACAAGQAGEMGSELSAFASQLHASLGREAQLRSEVDVLQEEACSLQACVEEERARARALGQELEEAQQEVLAGEAALLEARQRLQETALALEQQRRAGAAHSAQLDQLQQEVQERDERISALEASHAAREARACEEAAALQSRLADVSSELARTAEKACCLRSELAAKEVLLAGLSRVGGRARTSGPRRGGNGGAPGGGEVTRMRARLATALAEQQVTAGRVQALEGRLAEREAAEEERRTRAGAELAQARAAAAASRELCAELQAKLDGATADTEAAARRAEEAESQAQHWRLHVLDVEDDNQALRQRVRNLTEQLAPREYGLTALSQQLGCAMQQLHAVQQLAEQQAAALGCERSRAQALAKQKTHLDWQVRVLEAHRERLDRKLSGKLHVDVAWVESQLKQLVCEEHAAQIKALRAGFIEDLRLKDVELSEAMQRISVLQLAPNTCAAQPYQHDASSYQHLRQSI